MEKCCKCKSLTIDIETMKWVCKENMSQFHSKDDVECEHYQSKYIEYPLTIQGIENHFSKQKSHYECGTLVKVRPCGSEYNDKTYLGIFLGYLPIDVFISFRHDDQKLYIQPHLNPAIFVPELKKIVYGCESWWGRIESLEDFKEITSEDIQNVWYVKLLKSMMERVEIKDSNQ